MNLNAVTQVTLRDLDIKFSAQTVWPDDAVPLIITYPFKEAQYLTYSMLKPILNVHTSTQFLKLCPNNS